MYFRCIRCINRPLNSHMKETILFLSWGGGDHVQKIIKRGVNTATIRFFLKWVISSPYDASVNVKDFPKLCESKGRVHLYENGNIRTRRLLRLCSDMHVYLTNVKPTFQNLHSPGRVWSDDWDIFTNIHLVIITRSPRWLAIWFYPKSPRPIKFYIPQIPTFI